MPKSLTLCVDNNINNNSNNYIGLTIIFDYFLAINNPLRYSVLVTGKRIRYAIIFIWSVSLLVSILPFLGWREVRPRTAGGYCQYHLNLSKSYILFLHSLVCVTPLVITCCAYCKIFQVAKRQAQKIAAMTVSEILARSGENRGRNGERFPRPSPLFAKTRSRTSRGRASVLLFPQSKQI